MEMVKVGFLRRLVAYFIDGIILSIVSWILQLIFGAPMVLDPTTGQTATSMMGVVGTLLVIVIEIAYFVYFWSSSGQTPGKKIMGIKVVTTDGQLVSFGKAFLRLVGYVISGFVFCLGFIWIIFDSNKQGWHDKIAGTYVIKA
jgi:uncharacterized RDD family membrane protein YckC